MNDKKVTLKSINTTVGSSGTANGQMAKSGKAVYEANNSSAVVRFPLYSVFKNQAQKQVKSISVLLRGSVLFMFKKGSSCNCYCYL